MSDEELIARLRAVCTCNIDSTPCMAEDDCRDALAAADRIEALERERDQWVEHTKNAVWADSEELKLANARAERLEAALREIAAEASVTVHTWKNGINFKKMYEGWRKIAVERIDIARATLKGADHE